MEDIYFPMTCDILTVGHIKCLEHLAKRGRVTIGLLTEKGLKGYKQTAVPYKDREYILETIAIAIGNIDIVPQDSLDPTANLKKYKYDVIASGDGWEKKELEAIKRLKIKALDLKLRGEKTKQYSSSKIKQKIWKQNKQKN
jgi:glycerol-3-phosphate cytidylyltransferase-like family protein